MKTGLKVIALASYFLLALPAYCGLTEVFGVYRHVSKDALLKDLAERGIKRQGDSEKSRWMEDSARSSFIYLTKTLLQSKDPLLRIEPESWPIEILVFQRAPDGTAGIAFLLVGYCGDRQVFVMPVFDDTFKWQDISKTLDSKYQRVSLKEGNGMWSQSSVLSPGTPVRTIIGVRIPNKPGLSALVLYMDVLNTMNYQADLYEREKRRRRGF